MKKKAWISFIAMIVIVVLGAAKVSGVADSVWSKRHPFGIWSLRASCQNNLKQLGLTVKMFANESRGEVYPQLSSEEGKLMFEESEVYPEYLDDPDILVCPGVGDEIPAELFDDGYYVYTGHLMRSDEDVLNFAEYYTAQMAVGGDFSENMYPADASYGDEGVLYRLREGIERFFITDINNPAGSAQVQSTIPVMWDWPDNHQQGWGGNVLYMDGHVEWQAYPGEFPMTETCINTLAALANYVPPTAWAITSHEDIYTDEEDPTGYKRSLVANCQNNLKQLGLINKMFANESSGEVYPLLSSESGRLMYFGDEVFPEYLIDEDVLLCPSPAEQVPEPAMDDQHYVYLSHYFETDEDVQSFANVYPSIIASGGDFSGNITAPSSYGDGTTLLRLREGMERFLITDINNPAGSAQSQSKIPVLIEWPDNHEGGSGGNVLFMDGHVEWMAYPGEFPMTEATITTLAALAEHAPVTEWSPLPSYLVEGLDPYRYTLFCQGNLNTHSFVYDMYSYYKPGNDDESYPQLSSEAGRLMYDESDIPFFTKTRAFSCPGTTVDGDDIAFDDDHYVYLGYVMTNDADVLSFVDAYQDQILAGGDFSLDLNVPSSYGEQLYRLQKYWNLIQWPERFLLNDSPDPYEQIVGEHEIPVMIEWPDHHEGLLGGNVLFLDGHREWIDYPGKFPMTETTINALANLAGYVPTTEWANKGYDLENDPQLRALCEWNISIMGYTLRYFSSNEGEGNFPPLSSQDGQLMMTGDRYFQYTLIDLERLNCPGSELAYQTPSEDDHSYAYLGYLVRDENELQRFAQGYQQRIAAGGDFTTDLLDGENTVYRLRDDLLYFLSGSEVYPWYTYRFAGEPYPVMIEWPDNHEGIRGGNVAYSDGHVEWLDYPGEFPMSVEAMDILTDLAGRSGILPILSPTVKERAKDVFQNFKDLKDGHDPFLDLAESGLGSSVFNQLDLDNDGLLSIPELLRTAIGPTGQRKPVYVDFESTDTETGSASEPFDSLLKGANFVSSGGRVCMNPGSSSERLLITGPMVLERNGTTGTVRIGEESSP